MVHRVAYRAEMRVERELIADYKRLSGKNGLLFQIAESSMRSFPSVSISSPVLRWQKTESKVILIGYHNGSRLSAEAR